MKNNKYTISHEDSFNRDGKWSLVRRSLGISSFGINLVTISSGESIPEHTETERNQEELFVVLEGSPTMVIDGEEIQTPEGTYIRLDPEPKRYIKNTKSLPAKVLIISAPVTSGYKPLDWA